MPVRGKKGKGKGNKRPVSSAKRIMNSEFFKLHSNGRRTILTMDLIEEFALALPKVMFIETISDLLGVNRITWRTWIKQGKEEVRRIQEDEEAEIDPRRKLHVLFYYTYKQGLAKGEWNALQVINKAAKKYWYAAAWMLERSKPHKYGANAREIRELQKEVAELAKHIGKGK